MQILDQGIISFSETLLNNYGIPNEIPFIAPLYWDDPTIITYYRVTEDQATLKKVHDLIADTNPGLSAYQPRIAVIATWFVGLAVCLWSLRI